MIPGMSSKVFCLDKVHGGIALGIRTMKTMPKLKGRDGALVGTDKAHSWLGTMFIVKINARRNDRLIREQDSIQ